VSDKTGFGFDDRIYWTSIQLVTTVHYPTHCHLLRVDTLDCWPHFTTPLYSLVLLQSSPELRLTTFSSQIQSYVTTVTQSASLSWCQAPIWGLRPDFYLSDSCGFVDVGRPLRRKDGSVFYNVQYICILHVSTWMYIQCTQGLCQSRPVEYLYPRKRGLVFQESICTETCLWTRSLAMGLHVTIFTNSLSGTDCRILGCDTVWSSRWILAFRSNLLSPFSW
jgi:hypothetical protein